MNIRKATISRINHLTGIADIVFHTDSRNSQLRSDLQLTQPYAGRGWGIRSGVESSSICIVAEDADHKPYIVGYLTDDSFHRDGAEADLNDLSESFQIEPKFKTLREGEIALQSKANSNVFSKLALPLRVVIGLIKFSEADIKLDFFLAKL